MAVRIICIKKDDGEHENPYVAIDHLEWVNEKGEAYIMDQFGNKIYLIPAISPKGNKYVKTVIDETVTDSLLMLPECAL
jgi:hypothetical protein